MSIGSAMQKTWCGIFYAIYKATKEHKSDLHVSLGMNFKDFMLSEKIKLQNDTQTTCH